MTIKSVDEVSGEFVTIYYLLTCAIFDFSKVNEGDTICEFYDVKECRYEFAYEEIEGVKASLLVIRALKTPECQAEAENIYIIIYVVASVILIGILTLFIWRCLMTVHDRREFERFEKEKLLAKWDTVRIDFYNFMRVYQIFFILSAFRVRIHFTKA